MNDHEQKQQARRERLQAAADKAEREANALATQARERRAAIPLGQPMMPDHHSYRRDRRYRDRNNTIDKRAYTLGQRAAELRAKADAVGTAGISSDDSDAVAKLRAKLDEREALQERMKARNATIRKAVRKGLDPVEALVASGTARALAVAIVKPDFAGRTGHPRYELTNNAAEIRRLKKRIEALDVERVPRTEKFGNVELQLSAEANRVRLVFPGKPSAEVRALLKSRGFRWSPKAGAWQRQWTPAGQNAALELVKKLAE